MGKYQVKFQTSVVDHCNGKCNLRAEASLRGEGNRDPRRELWRDSRILGGVRGGLDLGGSSLLHHQKV